MKETHDPALLSQVEIETRRSRERIAAALAGVIVLIAVIVLLVSVFVAVRAEESGQAFTNLKDILGFLNPLLGVILGYYFNKVSSENRAETAEKNARVAAADAQEAEAARLQMWQENQQTRQQSKQMWDHMTQLMQAADAMLQQPSPDAVSFSPDASPDQETITKELWRAVENARQFAATQAGNA